MTVLYSINVGPWCADPLRWSIHVSSYTVHTFLLYDTYPLQLSSTSASKDHRPFIFVYPLTIRPFFC